MRKEYKGVEVNVTLFDSVDLITASVADTTVLDYTRDNDDLPILPIN